MLKLNQETRKQLNALFKTELGVAVIASLKKVIVEEDNAPANALDGNMYALLLSRKEGELDTIKQIIKIGESNG